MACVETCDKCGAIHMKHEQCDKEDIMRKENEDAEKKAKKAS